MADYTHIVPFIKQIEGGYKADDAGKGPVNKGILWSTWQGVFGNTWDRFMAMSDADWLQIYKTQYWDAIHGDEIQNQAIADFLIDWYWGSGAYAIGYRLYANGTDFGTYGVQKVLNDLGANLSIDGGVGPLTLSAINSANANDLLDGLNQNRADYYNALVAWKPGLWQGDLAGWMNRLNSLYSLVGGYIGDVANAITTNPGSSGAIGLMFVVGLVILYAVRKK